MTNATTPIILYVSDIEYEPSAIGHIGLRRVAVDIMLPRNTLTNLAAEVQKAADRNEDRGTYCIRFTGILRT